MTCDERASHGDGETFAFFDRLHEFIVGSRFNDYAAVFSEMSSSFEWLIEAK